ncbi:MAG: electron transport complex subunit RsxA [Defluviitaleaceae bacterium]|nr:electron transport complex subunit RsxA [Defluviitaleaceae bacterium]
MNLILLFLSAAVVNNFVLTRFLGICPFVGVSKKLDAAVGMGVAVTFVLTLSAAVAHLVYTNLLVPFDMVYLHIIAFILIVAALVQLVEMFLKKSSPTLYTALGVYLPLITTNCAIIGAVLINMNEGYNFIESVVHATGAGVGFLMAIVVFAGIRERIERCDVPRSFRGFPIALLAAGLMSIVFLGFAGLI